MRWRAAFTRIELIIVLVLSLAFVAFLHFAIQATIKSKDQEDCKGNVRYSDTQSPPRKQGNVPE